MNDASPHTIRRYATVVRDFLAWYVVEYGCSLSFDGLVPTVVIAYRNQLQTLRQPSTVNVHISALRTWGTWLEAEGYVAHNPTQRLKIVGHAGTARIPHGLADRAINGLLAEAQRTGARAYAIVMLLLQSGLRIGECAALYWGDITLGERSGDMLVRSGKGRKTRVVPLTLSARQALATYAAPILGASSPSLKDVVAVWPHGSHAQASRPIWQTRKRHVRAALTDTAIRRIIAILVRLCEARGFLPPHSKVSAHTFRHTFAMAYLTAHPGDLAGLATILGHATLDTTRIYANPTTDQLRQRMEGLALNAYGD
ncbi:MAG: tyrosine-type recombinase/integrase [Herpetosiphonaceae bacterium]|nr:tyrosine-type recombinase/integrase [Herpetosiphonaceae bacterium]